MADDFSIARTHAQSVWIQNLIKLKIVEAIPENLGWYRYVDSTISKQEAKRQINSNSEFMQTNLMKNWTESSNSKHIATHQKRFYKICCGYVNPNFKINPNTINKDNWQQKVKEMRKAILEIKNNDELSSTDKNAIRFAIGIGLEIKMSKQLATKLGIENEGIKAKKATLHITKEQYDSLKRLLKHDRINFVKAGVKLWTGVRPSTIYLLELDGFHFSDKTSEYVEVNGKIIYKKETIDLLRATGATVDIKTETKRICNLPSVYEHKTGESYPKYIYDEDYVIELEKLVNTRRSQHKKYLFWDDNHTDFNFMDYDKIVRSKVNADNKFFKEKLFKIGFKDGDFGVVNRANYAFRHFATQLWLDYTDGDITLVSKMFHESPAMTQKFYGEMKSSVFESKMDDVRV